MPFHSTQRVRFVAISAMLLGTVQCKPEAGPTTIPRSAASQESASTAPPPSSTPAASSETPQAQAPLPIADDYVVLVTDPRTLSQVERRGGSLGSLLDGAPGTTNDALARQPRYASIVKSVAADVAKAKTADPSSGQGLAFAHRLFDVRKLTASEARFELIAIVNRLDRQHVAPSTCGEVRFVYRLSYATTRSGVAIASRLPATLAVSFWSRDKSHDTPGDAGGGDCRAIATRWRRPAGAKADALASWLLAPGGPVGPLDALRARFKSVEANVQLVRWPSTTRPDLGGHAEYLLRAFVPGPSSTRGGPALVAGPLENTPDVAKLERDSVLRRKLLAWMSDASNVARLDAGTAILPEEFLTTRAISVSPRGLSRRANRPFRQIFGPTDIATVDPAPASRRYAKSPAALLRRLDELSCQGCHQSRSVAGFHLVGEEIASEGGANAVALATSPHLSVDLARRRRRTRAIALSGSVDAGRDDGAAPIAERSDDEPGRYGAHCGLGDPGFAGWTCAPGLQCAPDDASTDDGDVGVCLPAKPAAGDPCQAGVIAPNADPHRDRITKVVARACGAANACETNRVGFPAGMCESSCSALGPNAVCAGIPILKSFNACLAQKTPFEQCIKANTTPGGVRACSADAPCRDDYVCAGSGAVGACMPPYFLFQLRVDGHP